MTTHAIKRVLGAAMLALGLTGGALAQTPLVLNYWSLWNESEPQAAALKQTMADYTALHPDVTFKVTWNGRQNQTSVRTALSGGTRIDLVDADSDSLNGGLVAEGLVAPFNDVLGTDGPDGGKFGDLFFPGLLDLVKFNGSLSQIPYNVLAMHILYNQNMMDQAGVATPPATWTDWLAALEKVKALGKNGIAIEGNAPNYNIKWFTYPLERLAGADFLMTAAEDKTGEVWRDPAVAKVAAMERELWDKGYISSDSPGLQWPMAQEALAAGDTAAELVGSWLPIELADKVEDGFVWGGIPFPSVDGGLGSRTDTEVILISFAVLKDSPVKDTAIDFIKFALSRAQQTAFANTAKSGVANRDVPWVPELASSYAVVKGSTRFLNESQGVKAKYPDYNTLVLEAVHQQFFLGQLTAQQFVGTLVSKTKDYWASK